MRQAYYAAGVSCPSTHVQAWLITSPSQLPYTYCNDGNYNGSRSTIESANLLIVGVGRPNLVFVFRWIISYLFVHNSFCLMSGIMGLQLPCMMLGGYGLLLKVIPM